MEESEKLRYSRHLLLREIGNSGQEKLKRAKALVIGAGGLGSSALYYLAAAGIGTIGVADFDLVEPSNLQRQILYRESSIGKAKVDEAERALKALRGDLVVEKYPVRVSSQILEVISRYDFILDCVDRFETKFLINDACVYQKKPFCHAGVVKFGGQVFTYVPEKGPCLRCFLKRPPEGSTCEALGIVGAAAGMIGSVQALEAIKYLTGAGELLTGKVFLFDGLNASSRVVPFPIDENCPVCQNPAFSFEERLCEYEER